jgi:hypothetical protein
VWRTGLATSLDGKSWVKHPGNPVLEPGSSGWDARYIAANGAAVVVDDQMYYYYAGQSTRGITSIGLAVSRDGYKLAKSQSPVLGPGLEGEWDEHSVSDPYVLRDGKSLYMYFLGMNRVGVQKLGVAKSLDGVKWIKHPGNPILDVGRIGDFDVQGLGEPSVIKLGHYYLMAYTGRGLSEERTLGFAVSFDGVNWRKLDSHLASLSSLRTGWKSKVLCDSTFLQGAKASVVRVWYGGGRKADPAENIDGKLGYFEVEVPPWAWQRFVCSDKHVFGDLPSTQVLRGSYPAEEDGTCWIAKEASIYLDRKQERFIHLIAYVPHGLLTKREKSVEVRLTFLTDNKEVGAIGITEDGLVDTTVELPDTISPGPLEFKIRVSHVFTPASDGNQLDRRELGIIIKSLELE